MKLAREDGSIRWTEPEQALLSRDQASLRERMGDGPYDSACRSGTELSRQQAVELAPGGQPG